MNEKENKEFLTKQIITYIGNKRSLLPFIGNAVDEAKKRLGKKKHCVFRCFFWFWNCSSFSETAFANNLCERFRGLFIFN